MEAGMTTLSSCCIVIGGYRFYWESMKLDNLSGEGDGVRLLDLVERKNKGDKINKWIKEEEREKGEKGRRKKGVGGKGL